ncbi:hypothetical protein ACQRXC_03820 [Niallia taxi]|uniref:hypothetical protein n=1 Tax=Niallia taxi TaxID=2499688 RepID=UPI003F5DECE7
MSQTYGKWHKGIKPSKWDPDYGHCSKEEVEKWKRDLDKENQGQKELEGYYGLGSYE